MGMEEKFESLEMLSDLPQAGLCRRAMLVVLFMVGKRQHMFSQDAHEEGKRPMVGMEEKFESSEMLSDLLPAG